MGNLIETIAWLTIVMVCYKSNIVYGPATGIRFTAGRKVRPAS